MDAICRRAGPAAANQPQLQGFVTEVAAARAINILGGAEPATPIFPEALMIVVLASTQIRPLFFYRYADTGQWAPMGTAMEVVGPVASQPLALIPIHSSPMLFSRSHACILPGLPQANSSWPAIRSPPGP